MDETPLQRAFTFNREIASLSATGLPIDIGLQRGETLETKLDHINAHLATRVESGETLDQAIRNATELPTRYRASLWTWLHHPNPTIALDCLLSPAQTKSEFGRYVGKTLFYPLLLLCLAYLGLLLLCLYTGPTLESLSISLLGSNESTLWLKVMRDSILIWAIIFPVIMVAILIGWHLLRRQSNWKWMPGSRRYYKAFADANLAKHLAILIEDGQSSEEALALLRWNSETADLQRQTDEELPPILRWAVASDLGSLSLIGVLNLAAESYRQIAERQRNLWRLVMPAMTGAVLGGIIVLAYGLTLFLPFIELLYSVANVEAR
ncbi:MAG: hypothetical protein VYA84_08990 [Planctomycetota bacterium]|nr:hypothetical protein [Planctomycetota bacterium]